MAVTRETLYTEVWAEPMTVVASRHDVSSNYLARVCHALNVPHPPRGYWAKVKVGTAPPRPELPEATDAHDVQWERGESLFTPVQMPPRVLPEPGSKRRKWARPPIHSLVKDVEQSFQNAWVTDAGYLKSRKRSVPDVFASRAGLLNGLKLASELYLTFEDHGYKVALAANAQVSHRPTVDHRGRIVKNEQEWVFARERWSLGRHPKPAIDRQLKTGHSR